MSKKQIKNYIIIIISIIIVAGLGSLFVNLGMNWYDTLLTPTEWVPNFVIPIVWTTIYILFAVILFIWIKNDQLSPKIITFLIINGVLNILWCLVFFTLNQLLLGNIIIVINAFFAFVLIYEISKSKKLFSYILSIYPIWICIAFTFNNALWIL